MRRSRESLSSISMNAAQDNTRRELVKSCSASRYTRDIARSNLRGIVSYEFTQTYLPSRLEPQLGVHVNKRCRRKEERSKFITFWRREIVRAVWLPQSWQRRRTAVLGRGSVCRSGAPHAQTCLPVPAERSEECHGNLGKKTNQKILKSKKDSGITTFC